MTPETLRQLAQACDTAADKLEQEGLKAVAPGALPPWLVTLLTILAQILPQILPILQPTNE